MSRQFSTQVALLLTVLTAFTGCQPIQPFYFRETGDLAHYLDKATDLEYPDVQAASLAEVEFAHAPLTLSNPEFQEFWDLQLEEVVAIAMQNSKVIRNLGALTQVGVADGLIGRTAVGATVYDPAIFESDPQRGVEAALSEFDAQFASTFFWEKTDRPRNTVGFGEFFPTFEQLDRSQFESTLNKRTATGAIFTARQQTIHTRVPAHTRIGIPPDESFLFGRRLAADWFTALEAEVSQPLLRGRGAQINRIPVVLARINTDISLADFEAGVRNLVLDVENAYWDLHFAYRNLEAGRVARDSAQVTWKQVYTRLQEGVEDVQSEAQSREQYFFFRAQVETALRDVYNFENRLRFLMGLAATDGRLIRPSDEPTMARVDFDWRHIHGEALFRSPELRRQKWVIKQREMELIAARNQLLPQLNVVAMHRWLGMGDRLLGSGGAGIEFPEPDSVALEELFRGNYQESRVGVEFVPPAIGARRELAGVRNVQLLLAREKARLEDMELNLSHLLSTSVRNLDGNHQLAQTHFNRWAAAETEVQSVEVLYEGGRVRIDRVLEAHRRRAQTQIDYYRALVEYSKSIAEIHFRKGSLLEYNGVQLAEGPWPAKAYWDAMGHARQRDASYELDYGWTRPRVISRGPVPQHVGDIHDGLEISDEYAPGELIPTPEPTPAELPGAPAELPMENALPRTPGPITSAPSGPAIPAPFPADDQQGVTSRIAREPSSEPFQRGSLSLHGPQNAAVAPQSPVERSVIR